MTADTVLIGADGVVAEQDRLFILEVEEVQADEALETVQFAVRIDGAQQLLPVFRQIIVQIHNTLCL